MTDNPVIRIYVNKIENRITFKFSTSKAMKLLGSTKNKTAKEENGENLSHL